MAGERISHPDDPEAREAYDLLALASAPWTEGRLRSAPPRVVAAQHWITYVGLLLDSATLDVDSIAESIADEVANHNTGQLSGKAAQQAANRIFTARVARARKRLREATQQRTELRLALLLDEE